LHFLQCNKVYANIQTKSIIIIVCDTFQLVGCIVTVIGAWLLMEPSKGHLLNLFAPHATPTETIYFVAYSLLVLGFTVLTVGFFGCRAALHESQCVLVIVSSPLFIVSLNYKSSKCQAKRTLLTIHYFF
jgi:uncharacterized membrane protein YiaA